MYEGYSNAAKEELPNAAVVVDRFHVAKNYRAGADKARKEVMRDLKKDLPATDYAELKGVMWAFRTPLKNLTEQQQAPLFKLWLFPISWGSH
jgi:Transposase.